MTSRIGTDNASAAVTVLKRLGDSAARVLGILSAAFLVFAVVLNCANVFGRYVLAKPIIWAEEAMSFCVIASVFCAIPVLAWKRRHMRMDIVPSLLPTPVRSVLDVVTDALLAVFVLAFASFARPLLAQLVSSGEKSEALGVPMVIPHTLVTAGLALMGVAFLAHTVVGLWRFRKHPDRQ